MSGSRDRVIFLRDRDPEGALENLNRVTGLRFARWPESLVEAGAVSGMDDMERETRDDSLDTREAVRR